MPSHLLDLLLALLSLLNGSDPTSDNGSGLDPNG
jgi:hypothetical protein